MPNRVLFFVRHGQYLSTAHEGEEPDGALTEVGQAQSALTAKRLQDYPIQVIHHSTLQRAVETADIIANAFPDVGKRPSPLLRECIPCVPEGMESHFAHIPPEFVAGGMVQAQQAFATYITPLIDGDSNQYEIVVSHGNLINAIASQAVKAPLASWLNFDVQQCSVTEICISGTGWIKLVRHNDVGHMPSNLHTFI